jgi:NitT/TauT family transport system substrate-binding protein
MTRFGIIFVVSATVLFGCSFGVQAGRPIKKVSFIPMWSPQAQFAGYYVAYEKGIYQKYGLDVAILEGGSSFPSIEALKDGKADFAVAWLASALEKRADGVKLVNIAQIVQRSALMLVARKSSGIQKPEDMNHKKVGLWEGDLGVQPRAFLKKYQIDADIIPQSYTVNLFLAGGTDVVSAMWYNEYHTILNSGIDENELTTFFFDRYGLNFPEDGIYAMETTLDKDPQAAASFVEASLEGWAYAFDHEDEALDIVLKYMKKADLPANRVHQKWMLERMKDVMILGGALDNIGVLNKKDYERVAQELSQDGLIKSAPAFDEFYKALKNK